MTISLEQAPFLRRVNPTNNQAVLFSVDAIRYNVYSEENGPVRKHAIISSNLSMPSSDKQGVPHYGQIFLDQLSTVVAAHLDDSEFSVEMLAEGVNLSRTHLHRKLKSVSNMTPTTFIQIIRLTRAAELLAGGDKSVTQVAYAVGFAHLSYFARLFQERYGVLPSQYGKAIILTEEGIQ